MPRKPKWTNKPEMWKYCAKLVNGAASYADVHTKLSLDENRKRFGLVEVPSEDTIRTRLNNLNLLDATVPGTAGCFPICSTAP